MSPGGDQAEHLPHDIRMLVKRQIEQVLVAHQTLVAADPSAGTDVLGDFHARDVVELGVALAHLLAAPPERWALGNPTRKPRGVSVPWHSVCPTKVGDPSGEFPSPEQVLLPAALEQFGSKVGHQKIGLAAGKALLQLSVSFQADDPCGSQP